MRSPGRQPQGKCRARPRLRQSRDRASPAGTAGRVGRTLAAAGSLSSGRGALSPGGAACRRAAQCCAQPLPGPRPGELGRPHGKLPLYKQSLNPEPSRLGRDPPALDCQARARPLARSLSCTQLLPAGKSAPRGSVLGAATPAWIRPSVAVEVSGAGRWKQRETLGQGEPEKRSRNTRDGPDPAGGEQVIQAQYGVKFTPPACTAALRFCPSPTSLCFIAWGWFLQTPSQRSCLSAPLSRLGPQDRPGRWGVACTGLGLRFGDLPQIFNSVTVKIPLLSSHLFVIVKGSF